MADEPPPIAAISGSLPEPFICDRIRLTSVVVSCCGDRAAPVLGDTAAACAAALMLWPRVENADLAPSRLPDCSAVEIGRAHV